MLLNLLIVVASFSSTQLNASAKQSKPTERQCIATYGISSICTCNLHKLQYSSYPKNQDEAAGAIKNWKPVAYSSSTTRKSDAASQ
jgi:hypothetical protein